MPGLARDIRSVLIGTTDTQLAGPNPRRNRLVISAPPTNRITISFGDTPAVLDQGITLYPGNAPFTLQDDGIASAFTEGIRAISATAGQQVNFVDVFHA